MGGGSAGPWWRFAVAERSAMLSAFDHVRLLERVGFVEVDVAWKREGAFVCGGRRAAG